MQKSVSCEELRWSSQNTQVTSLLFFKLSNGFLFLYNKCQHFPAVYSEDLWSSWSILSPISLSLYCSHSASCLVIQHSSQTPTWGSLHQLWISTFSGFPSEIRQFLSFTSFTVYSKVPASVRLLLPSISPPRLPSPYLCCVFLHSPPLHPVYVFYLLNIAQENANYHKGRFCFVSVPLMPTAPKMEGTQIKHLLTNVSSEDKMEHSIRCGHCMANVQQISTHVFIHAFSQYLL